MLYDKLTGYAACDTYPMHMPGHKRNAKLLATGQSDGRRTPGLPYEIDITEVHGFDDLHDPHGVLRETAELASQIYGSKKTFMLVNGSTVGILAAVGALAARGDRILIAGSCHRSVNNAAWLFGLDPVYLTPETDEATGIACSIDPADIESALYSDPEIRLVVLTSPSYEGVISNVRSIAEIARRRNTPFIVDAAHGAHLGLSPGFPESPARAGADVVVMSLHKTLPALTQCSLLHVCGERADAGAIAHMLSVLQTSSPSYVLMASIDRCLRLLMSDGDRLFGEYKRNLDNFGREAGELKNLTVVCHGADSVAAHPGFFAFDPGKLVIITKSTALSGIMLMDILREEYRIELELAREDYAIAMTSICDSAEGFRRLAGALAAIDR